jgi:hypothetical protein
VRRHTFNVKGSQRACPFHTGKVKSSINVKTGTAGIRGSHLSQKTRKMGHPFCFSRIPRSKPTSKGSPGFGSDGFEPVVLPKAKNQFNHFEHKSLLICFCADGLTVARQIPLSQR